MKWPAQYHHQGMNHSYISLLWGPLLAALPPSLKVEQSSSADRAENLKQQDSMYCRNHQRLFQWPGNYDRNALYLRIKCPPDFPFFKSTFYGLFPRVKFTVCCIFRLSNLSLLTAPSSAWNLDVLKCESGKCKARKKSSVFISLLASLSEVERAGGLPSRATFFLLQCIAHCALSIKIDRF